MSEFIGGFEFQQFQAVTKAELEALRALILKRQTVTKKGTDGRDGRDAVVDYKLVERKIGEMFGAVRLPRDGTNGKDGKDGVGLRGPKGERGERGPIPDHKWDGTKLAFEKPDGEFGKAVDLQGPPGGDGVGGMAPIIGGGSASLLLAVNSYFPSGW